MRKSLLFFAFAIIVNFTKSQIVNVPDANFKAYLLENSAINTNSDSEIQVSEATAFIGTINCSNKNIANLTGIEAFINLTKLSCYGNQLENIDISKNTALQELDCQSNQLTSLDVSKNTTLKVLYCYSNQLMSLDVSKSTALQYLYCYFNQLASLDVSKNTALRLLYCQSNQLTSLDVSKNTNLQELDCFANQLTGLDVSKNTGLQYLLCHSNPLMSLDVSKNKALLSLDCSYNQLTSLDVSKNTALRYLVCYSNQLKSLDVSKNTDLKILYCYSNQLTSLNLKNGNNDILYSMRAYNSPNLNCIQVDNVANANSYTISKDWQKDASASYNKNCTLSITDFNKKEIAIFPNPVKDLLQFSEEVFNIKITDVSGKVVKQISGLGKSVNVANLAKGIYIISATAKSGEVVSQKVIKE